MVLSCVLRLGQGQVSAPSEGIQVSQGFVEWGEGGAGDLLRVVWWCGCCTRLLWWRESWKFLIYGSMFVRTLTCDHGQWLKHWDWTCLQQKWAPLKGGWALRLRSSVIQEGIRLKTSKGASGDSLDMWTRIPPGWGVLGLGLETSESRGVESNCESVLAEQKGMLAWRNKQGLWSQIKYVLQAASVVLSFWGFTENRRIVPDSMWADVNKSKL